MSAPLAFYFTFHCVTDHAFSQGFSISKKAPAPLAVGDKEKSRANHQ
jgi:hypothetical protein